MASDFEYTGIANHQAGFREKATGTQYWIDASDDAQVELLDGDEVFIPSGGQRNIWSIRERRIVRYA